MQYICRYLYGVMNEQRKQDATVGLGTKDFPPLSDVPVKSLHDTLHETPSGAALTPIVSIFFKKPLRGKQQNLEVI